MRTQVEHRVSELKSEHKKGQQMLAELEAKEADLRQTLLRIAGAIQVLEELLAAAEAPAGEGDAARKAPAGDHLVQADA
jgi:hypothetical protein